MIGMRRSIKVSLDVGLVEEARSMEIDVSQAAEAGIARAVAGIKAAKQFSEEYPDVVKSNNEYVAKHGLPLRKYRSF